MRTRTSGTSKGQTWQRCWRAPAATGGWFFIKRSGLEKWMVKPCNLDGNHEPTFNMAGKNKRICYVVECGDSPSAAYVWIAGVPSEKERCKQQWDVAQMSLFWLTFQMGFLPRLCTGTHLQIIFPAASMTYTWSAVLHSGLNKNHQYLLVSVSIKADRQPSQILYHRYSILLVDHIVVLLLVVPSLILITSGKYLYH